MILRPAADEPSDAHKYRLWQVREQLREAGYVEQPDGTWKRPEPLRWPIEIRRKK